MCPTITDERIAYPGNIIYAERANTPGFPAPSYASCRALLLLFSRPATTGTPAECAAGSLVIKNKDVR